MKLKNGPDLMGLIDALNKREITVLEKDGGIISINARGGILIDEVFPPPGKNQNKKRVVRFSKEKDDYLDPILFRYAVELGIGLEILFLPLEKPGDL